MSEKRIPPMEPSMAYLHWSHAAGCVLDVFLENRAAEERGDPRVMKASADLWATNSMLRQAIFGRARSAWCQRTGLDATWFPLSEDAVARLYFRFRKRNCDEIAAFQREIERHSASRPKQAGLFEEDLP